VEKLSILAHKKGGFRPDKIAGMKFSDQINKLAAQDCYDSGRTPIIEENFKNDLHSFRGARNLIDHKTRSRREDARRQRQYTERMVQGPRIISEILGLQTKLQRGK